MVAKHAVQIIKKVPKKVSDGSIAERVAKMLFSY